MLRDHLVCGISDEAIHDRLLMKTALMLKKALEMALQNVREMQGTLKQSQDSLQRRSLW